VKYSQANMGRIFVIRLEDGEILHEVLERFARENDVVAAVLVMLGGADSDSRFVVGPEDARSRPVVPLEHVLTHVHEAMGTGTIFPDKKGIPTLHMHVSAGRLDRAVTGCVRKGVRIWEVAEVILFELLDTGAARRFEATTGFELLCP